MPFGTRRGVFVFVPALLGVASGADCSSARGGQDRSSSSPTAVAASAQWPCLAGTDAVAITNEALSPVTIVTLGTGPVAVVLSNESDQDLCDWLPFATDLAAAHYRVVLYDYATAALPDLLVICPYLRAHGACRIGLIGASVGADGSLQAAAEMTPPADALVTLSAEGHVSDDAAGSRRRSCS